MKEQRLSIEVQPAAQTKGLVREAVLCRSGSFEGMNGPVVVTKEMLEQLKETYLKVHAEPTNENDYAPILINHDRNVEFIKGRLLTEGMEVKEWKEFDGKMQFGLFGKLRIDDEEAKKNVEAGKYAHLSISFDEEKWEIFEVSFVAVEAARGSIVLSQNEGDKNMELQKKLTTLSQKHQALAALTKESRKKRTAELSKITATATTLAKEIEALSKNASEIKLSIKASQVKGKFNELIRGGKMNPVELKKIDIKELAQMSENHLKVVLSSYEARPVMADVFQYGQTGSEVNMSKKLTPENMREAIALQKAGKNSVVLAEGEDEQDEEKLAANGEEHGEEQADKEKAMKSYAMDEEAYAKCLEEISGVHEKLSGVVESIKAMGGDVEKLAAEEKDEEKKELAIEEKDEKEGEEK
jgi:hypothetical protein